MQEWEGYSDEGLDDRLRDVRVPAALVERLRAVLLSSDEELDERLRSVPVPEDLLPRLERLGRRRRTLRWAEQWALAVSLLIGVGLGCYAAIWAVSENLQRRSAPVQMAAQEETTPAQAAVEQAPKPEGTPAAGDPAGGLAGGGAGPDIKLQRLRPLRPSGDLPSQWRLDRILNQNGADPFLDGTLARWPVLGAHRPFDELPELHKVPGPTPQGMARPLAPGFDLPFFIRAGVHPFVVPADPRLQTTVVPLGIGRASYELARRCVADGELPPQESVRVEEFLAAVDYGFPRPVANPVALHLAAGPSPFGGQSLRAAHGGEALRLVQIGVQAREQTRPKRAPMSLVLALDTSASMAWGGRLEMACRALAKLADGLDAKDQLALVSFAENAEVLAEEIGPDEAEPFRAALARLKPAGWTNVGGALRQAFALAARMPAPNDGGRAVVLLTDGMAELDATSKDIIEQRLKEAAAHGIRLEVVDLRQETDDVNLASQLQNFAAAGGGAVRRATDADEVGWALQEILTGKSQLVARDVRLRVTFRPQAVLQYRLLGHEAARLAGLLPARPEADFRSGQTATAVYEVLLRPKGSEEVAQAELSWVEPGTTVRRTQTRKLTRAMFASTVSASQPSLVAAAALAEVAELLRDSPFARQPPNPGSLARAMELAGVVDTRLRARPAFTEFMAMIQRAQKAKPARK